MFIPDLKFIMLLSQKFQNLKSEKIYMKKFTGQIQQLYYLCLYKQNILHIDEVFVGFFFIHIFRPEDKSERISITIATKFHPCIWIPQRIAFFILVSKNQQYLV